MKNHFKKNGFLYFILGVILVFSVLFPDFEITLSGGFAWLYFFICFIVAASLIVSGIFGGVISVESKGLIPWIKELRQKRKSV